MGSSRKCTTHQAQLWPEQPLVTHLSAGPFMVSLRSPPVWFPAGSGSGSRPGLVPGRVATWTSDGVVLVVHDSVCVVILPIDAL